MKKSNKLDTLRHIEEWKLFAMRTNRPEGQKLAMDVIETLVKSYKRK